MKRRRGSRPGRESNETMESAIAGEISTAPGGAQQERDDAEISGPAGPGSIGVPGRGEPKARPRSKSAPVIPGGQSNRDQTRWTGDRAPTGGNKAGVGKRRRNG